MELPDVIEQCLSLPGAEETQPFGPEALVYKVGGKMFAVTVPEDFPARINLKCDPERAIELRDQLGELSSKLDGTRKKKSAAKKKKQ